MKSKIIFVAFTAAFFSNVVFAAQVKKAPSSQVVSQLKERTVLLEKQVQSLQYQIDTIQTTDKFVGSNLDLLVELYSHGPAVVTSPALGVRRSAEDASDMMVNLSSMNEDLLLLQIRQKMDNYATKNHIPIPQRPIIALSGCAEGQVNWKRDYTSTDRADINLSWAELDVIGEASPWATAGLMIVYEDSKDLVNKATRVSNSRFKLDRGFLTIGQLNKFPLYLTMGQVFVPFGNYGSYMISDPSTKVLGRTKDRLIILGGYWKGLSAQISGFPGETKVIDGSTIFSHTSFNLGYEYSQDKFKINVNGSIMGNLAESDGMQSNVFAKRDTKYLNSETIRDNVYAISGRIKASYHPFTVMAEYVGALKRFNSNDLSFNGKGASPKAVNIEGAVEFKIKGKPNTFALGYGRTWEALALETPKHNFFASYSVSLIKNTILGFEYRHDIDYSSGDNSKGAGTAGAGSTAGVVGGTVDKNGTGRHRNVGIMKLGVYF